MKISAFAHNLTRIMNERSVNPGFLADMTGAYIGSVRKYMSGERFPKLGVIAGMSEVLNISPNELFVGLVGHTEIDDLNELYSYLTREPRANLGLLRDNTKELALYFKEHEPDLVNAGFGKRLKAVRDDAGITVHEFAKLYGATISQVYAIESGPHLPSFEKLVSLCNALHVSPAFLMRDMLSVNVELYGSDPIMKLVAELAPSKISIITALARNIMTR